MGGGYDERHYSANAEGNGVRIWNSNQHCQCDLTPGMARGDEKDLGSCLCARTLGVRREVKWKDEFSFLCGLASGLLG